MAEARLVQVDVSLAGGHCQRLHLESDSPILRGLLEALAARLAPGPRRVVLLQIPLEEGQSALTFTSDHLVALTTTPPVLVHAEDVIVTRGALSRIPARHVRFHDVLGASAKARLLEQAIARAPELVPSRVAGDVPDYRRSRIVNHPGDLAADLVARVRGLLPELCHRLDVPPFPVGQIEAQVTVHNDGDYYRVHNDNGTVDTRAREISYVYYFHREPKQFTGGELALFDSTFDDDGRQVPIGSPIIVEPADDSLVVFPSSCLHEVRPVHMLSHAMEDGRFTINGWVRRADEVPAR